MSSVRCSVNVHVRTSKKIVDYYYPTAVSLSHIHKYTQSTLHNYVCAVVAWWRYPTVKFSLSLGSRTVPVPNYPILATTAHDASAPKLSKSVTPADQHISTDRVERTIILFH